MISYIRGKVISQNERSLVIDVGGLGYQIATTPETIGRARIGEEFALNTYLAVREDALDLYGFLSLEERDFFLLLLLVSGIGPKSALSILSITSIDTLKKAIGTGDTSYLTKVSGIGRKTAEKIVLELRDKLRAGVDMKETPGALRAESDVLEALKAIGYSQNEARDALKAIAPEITDTNTRIKEALKILGGR
jgi:Holliday junction DNA helicase RuvA